MGGCAPIGGLRCCKSRRTKLDKDKGRAFPLPPPKEAASALVKEKRPKVAYQLAREHLEIGTKYMKKIGDEEHNLLIAKGEKIWLMHT